MSDGTSAERVLAILEMFERKRRPLSLKELAEYCDIPTSTCHALVQTLLKRAYLYHTGRRKDLYPTRKLYDIGATVVTNDMILQRVRPVMESLRESTRETVILGKTHKDGIIYIDVLEGPHTVRYSARVGEIKPLHSTSIGKTVLAAMKSGEIRDWLAEHPPQQMTANTITSYTQLTDDLEKAKARGYFVTRGENVPDVSAIAVPLHINSETFGLAVAGPAPRIEASLDHIVQMLKAAQASLLDQRFSQGDAGAV